jgi:hypothetical protein
MDDQKLWVETKVKLHPEATRELYAYTQPPHKVPIWKLASDGLRLYLRILKARHGEEVPVPGQNGLHLLVVRTKNRT